MNYQHYLDRDRDEELARVRARRAERERMRRIYRRRRAVLVAVVALPIAALALASAWPQGSATRARTAATTTSAASEARVEQTGPRRVMPTEVRAVHVSIYRAGDAPLIGALVANSGPGGLNAVEVDVKDERGVIGFSSGMPALALQVGAARDYYDARGLVARLHRAHLWVIGRVVVFEDPVLATSRPVYAIRTRAGGIWTNANGLAWTNPYDHHAWQYVIGVARAAGRVGFDEIEFDYVRFPTDGNLTDAVFAHAASGGYAITITTFLRSAVDQLHRQGLIVSADLFGLAATHNLGIGQDPRRLANVLDVMSPMAYPCAYGPGQLGIADPCANPGDTVGATMQDWERQVHDAGGTAQIRPWLQAGSIGSGVYTPAQVRAQINAVRQTSPHGFMLWDSTSDYAPVLLSF